MPELVEVEAYRRLAERSVGRTVDAVDAPDTWFLKRGTTPESLEHALLDAPVVGARRIGKLLLLDVGDRVLGLRFGMTGRLLLDGVAGIEGLVYGSSREEPAWDRFALTLSDGGRLVIRDPRRLGGVELDPDVRRLGPDALGARPRDVVAALAGSDAPLKARLLDQAHVAGIGNLIADETLWRAGLDPARAAGSLSAAEARRLHKVLQGTLADMLERGGSHTGDLMGERVRGGRCPRDGAPLLRRTIGGRTTYSCPRHQG